MNRILGIDHSRIVGLVQVFETIPTMGESGIRDQWERASPGSKSGSPLGGGGGGYQPFNINV